MIVRGVYFYTPFFFYLNSNNMKTIKLSPIEYISNFKKIAKFKFRALVFHGNVYIRANTLKLEELGY